jgi:hypothetical protein
MPGDIARLSMLVAEAASDPARVTRMGVAARQRIARYSVGAAANGLMTAVEDARR